MEISITRETYEQLKATPQPGVTIDMKCTYTMTFTPHKEKPKRTIRTRRSPLDVYALSVRAAQRKLVTAQDRETQGLLLGMNLPMASGELAEKLAKALKMTKANASYRVSRMIDKKVLVPA